MIIPINYKRLFKAGLAIGLSVVLADQSMAQGPQRSGRVFTSQSAGCASEHALPLFDQLRTPDIRQQLVTVIDREIQILEEIIDNFSPRIEIVWLEPPAPPPAHVVVQSDPPTTPSVPPVSPPRNPPENPRVPPQTPHPPVATLPPTPQAPPPPPPPLSPPENPPVAPTLPEIDVWGDDGGGDCFCSGTLVAMADGSEKEIEIIEVGEEVFGRNGAINTVLATPIFPVGHRTLYIVNGTLRLTPEHPLLTDQGWKSLDPEGTQRVNPSLPVTRLQVGDRLTTRTGYEPVKNIAVLTGYGEDDVYSLKVSGDGTYIAEGYVVHHNFGAEPEAKVGDQSPVGEK